MNNGIEQRVHFRRVFWRITFDVVDHTIRLRQELTCWHEVSDWETEEDGPGHILGDPYWFRADRLLVNLQHRTVGGVTLAHDHAVFDGGYLECETYDLTAFAQACLAGDPGAESEPIEGENVSIRADVRLQKPGPGHLYPLFHLRQTGHPVVTLTQEIPGPSPDLVAVNWEIGAQFYPSARRYWINPSVDWHRVRVYQDEGGVFKFWSDSVPLGEHPIPHRPTFHFDPTPQTFFIGAAPNGAGGLDTLVGDIAFLEFDPNSSCGSCAN